MARSRIDLHLISDATGETLNSLARACLSQFEGIAAVQHRWPLIRSRFQLDRVLAGIEHEPGPVLYTHRPLAPHRARELLPAPRPAGGVGA